MSYLSDVLTTQDLEAAARRDKSLLQRLQGFLARTKFGAAVATETQTPKPKEKIWANANAFSIYTRYS